MSGTLFPEGLTRTFLTPSTLDADRGRVLFPFPVQPPLTLYVARSPVHVELEVLPDPWGTCTNHDGVFSHGIFDEGTVVSYESWAMGHVIPCRLHPFCVLQFHVNKGWRGRRVFWESRHWA